MRGGNLDTLADLPKWFTDKLRSFRMTMSLRAQPKIDQPRLLIAFADHLFFPYSYLWMLPRDGRRGCINRDFWPADEQRLTRGGNGNGLASTRQAMRGGGFRVLVHIILIVQSMLPTTYNNDGFILPTVLLYEAILMMRSLVVAVKYGFMSKHEFEVVMKGTYAESRATVSPMEVLKSFWRPDPALYLSEVERLGYTVMRPFGIVTTNITVNLQPAAAARLRARLAYDIRRLGLSDEFFDPLMKLLQPLPSSPGQFSLSSLVMAVRLASHPVKGWLARIVSSKTILNMTRILTVIAVLIPFSAPLLVTCPIAIQLDLEYPGKRLVWLYPWCGCDASCDPACTCVPVDPLTILLLLVLGYHFQRMNIAVLHFCAMGVLEAGRRQRSLQLWGGLLREGGWPSVVDDAFLMDVEEEAEGEASAAGDGEGGGPSTPSPPSPNRRPVSSGDDADTEWHKRAATMSHIAVQSYLDRTSGRTGGRVSGHVSAREKDSSAPTNGLINGGQKGRFGGAARKVLFGTRIGAQAPALRTSEMTAALDDGDGDEMAERSNSDFARQNVMECGGEMKLCDLPMVRPATVVMNDAQNVQAWVVGRVLLFHFGDRCTRKPSPSRLCLTRR